MKIVKKNIIILLGLILISMGSLRAKEIKKKVDIKKDNSIADQLKRSKKLRLNKERVIEYLMSNNYDVKKALLDYKGISSALKGFNAKYDFNLFGSGNYSYQKNPNSANTMAGSSTNTATYAAGINKIFSTGTSISASINGMYQSIDNPHMSINGLEIPIGSPEGYQTGIKVELQQELLRNFLGMSDRLTIKQLQNSEKMNKKMIELRLASLLVDALVGYWNVAVAEESLRTSNISLKSTIDIKNLILRKLRLGLAEKEDILDWRGKVLESRNVRDITENALFNAKLGVLRILNLDSSLDIEIVKSFKTTPPKIALEQAIKDAFQKRVDWNNQLGMIKNSELQYKIAFHGLLPSLKLKLGVGNGDYSDSSYIKTFNDVNSEFSVGLEMTYPLGNSAGNVKMRDTRLNLKKMHVELKDMEKKIRDEIITRVKDCKINFKIYEQTKRARQYKQNYYGQVYRKFKRGRYSAIQLKLALDSYIRGRQDELKSMVDYNVSLMRRDLARNVIFENFNIDIKGVLRRIED